MNVCDMCDALLTEAEEAKNPRWAQDLCDPCSADIQDANPEQTP